MQFLAATNVESVFFIVSGEIKSILRDLQAITMLKLIYAVYIFMQFINQDDLNKMIVDYKHVNGLFCTIEDCIQPLGSRYKVLSRTIFLYADRVFLHWIKINERKFPIEIVARAKAIYRFSIVYQKL